MAPNSLFCADVLLSNYSLTHLMFFAVFIFCRNPGQLADVMHRYSNPVDTGLLLVQSSESGRTSQSGTAATAVFFTRVHFEIFGLFFSRSAARLDKAVQQLIDVYSAENLVLCVDLTTSSSSSSSSSSLIESGLSVNRRCHGDDRRSETTRNFTDHTQEVATLRRSGVTEFTNTKKTRVSYSSQQIDIRQFVAEQLSQFRIILGTEVGLSRFPNIQ